MSATIDRIATAAGQRPRPVRSPSNRYARRAFDGHRYVLGAVPALDIELQRGEGYYAVNERQTGIFGAGPSPLEAMTDLQRAVREHLDVLERQAALSGDLARQRDYLRERISN